MAEISPELAAANKLIAELSTRLSALETAVKLPAAAPGAPVVYKPSAKKPYKKVLYHGQHVAPIVMDILDENDNDTVNIGLNDVVIVRQCPILPVAKPGHATAGTKVPDAAEAAE